jgi:hypothetical protein
MKRIPLVWILSAVAMLGVAAFTYWLGATLLPPRTTAQTVGTIVPWYLTWGMIWLTVVTALIIAGNLCAVGLNSGRSDSIAALLVDDFDPVRASRIAAVQSQRPARERRVRGGAPGERPVTEPIASAEAVGINPSKHDHHPAEHAGRSRFPTDQGTSRSARQALSTLAYRRTRST